MGVARAGTLARMDDAASRDRYWVSVHYRCCNVYQRVYFKKGSSETGGRCPRCLREVRLELREDAESGRFFEAGADAS